MSLELRSRPHLPAPARYDSDYYFLRCASEYFGGALQSGALIRLGAFGGILESLRQCVSEILGLGPLTGGHPGPLGHS